MNKQDDIWLDTARYAEFVEAMRALCTRLGYYINDVVVRQSSDRAPLIEVEMQQIPRRKEPQ